MSEPNPSTQPGETVPLRLTWRTAEEVPVYLANQFLLQFVTDGYIMAFGQATPPAILQPTQEELETIKEMPVPVRVLGRISMTPEQTRALMLLLKRQLDRFSPGLTEEAPATDVSE